MKTCLAVLVLLGTLFGCRAANELTGPDRPVPPTSEPTLAAPDPRMHPVVVTRPRVAAVVTTRPQVTPAFPCQVVSGDFEWKNAPCQPCEHVTGNFQPKNKPCYED